METLLNLVRAFPFLRPFDILREILIFGFVTFLSVSPPISGPPTKTRILDGSGACLSAFCYSFINSLGFLAFRSLLELTSSQFLPPPRCVDPDMSGQSFPAVWVYGLYPRVSKVSSPLLLSRAGDPPLFPGFPDFRGPSRTETDPP